MILNVNSNTKRVHIKESKIFLLKENFESEGVTFSAPTATNPYIDTTIQPIRRGDDSSTDLANKVADTRIWGSKNDVLHGDNTRHKATNSLSDSIISKDSMIKAYKAAIDAIRAGRRMHPNIPNCGIRTYNAIMGRLADPDASDEELIEYFSNRIYEFGKEYDMTINKFNRATNAADGETKVPRYDVGVVPGTDVKVIALFKFDDFNFSDAIKNGELRQTSDTDKKLGITDFRKDREKNENPFGKGGTNKKLKTTYDYGTVDPDIATNFSLSGIDTYSTDPFNLAHFKQQFKSRDAYNSDAEYNADTKQKYNSITQFMDKSILAARYALKNEGIKVDYIIPAPSSSKFNRYYCFNLSQKLGVPCKYDFFKRNLLNVELDKGIYNAGLTDKIISDTENTIRNAAINEISSLLLDTIKKFVSENFDMLSNISLTKSSREKASFNLICQFLKYYSCYGLYNIYEHQPKTSNLHMYLVNHFMDYTEIKKVKGYDSRHILTNLMTVIRTRLSLKYQEMLRTLDNQIWKYQDYLKDENGGFKISFCKKFKITDIDKKARQFVRNAYVVADEELDMDNHLFERYRNAHFLIIDEDMNSGGTLMLLIQALKDKVIGHVSRDRRGRYARIKSDQITCLVNAYTLKG